MDGIHDLGGMHGFGAVEREEHEPPFHAPWEAAVVALMRAARTAGVYNIDEFRHGIERMVPADYLSFTYFNKWCANYFMLMLDNGTITMEDVKRGNVDDPDPLAAARTLDDALEINSKADASFETEAPTEPGFAVGQTVRTHRHMPGDHTRLPRYARDAHGTIIAHHGCHALPDEGAKGKHVGDHLYTVSFAAAELWGPGANPRDTVTLDLWERYLVPA
jgi:nitrile hydratase